MPLPSEGGGAIVPISAALRPTVGLHGTVTAFNLGQEDWSEYIGHYFMANDIVTGV